MESCLRIKHFENSRGNRINSYGQNVCFINELLRHQADEVVDPGAELADFSIGEAALDGHGSHEFNQLTGEVGCEGTRLRGAVFTVRKQIFGADFPHRAAVEYRSGSFPLWRVIPDYNRKLSG